MPTHNPYYGDYLDVEYEVKNRDSGRVEVWETVPVDEQDSGANDEGYGYESCFLCKRVTEHDDCGTCLECDY